MRGAFDEQFDIVDQLIGQYLHGTEAQATCGVGMKWAAARSGEVAQAGQFGGGRHIEAGAGDPAARRAVTNASSSTSPPRAVLIRIARWASSAQLLGTDQVAGGRRERAMHRDHIGFGQHLIDRRALSTGTASRRDFGERCSHQRGPVRRCPAPACRREVPIVLPWRSRIG